MSEKREGFYSKVVTDNPETKEELTEILKSIFKEPITEQGVYALEQHEAKLAMEIYPKLCHFLEQFGAVAIHNFTENRILQLNIQELPQPLQKQFRERLPKAEANYGGFVHAIAQCIILLRKQSSDLMFARTISHELIHLLSFNSAQLIPAKDSPIPMPAKISVQRKRTDSQTSEELVLFPRRLGFVVIIDGKQSAFNDFEEAITTELAIRFEEQYFSDIPLLYDAIEEHNRNVGDINKDILFQDAKDDGEIAKAEKKNSGQHTIMTTKSYEYPSERNKLRNLIRIIYEYHRDKYANEDAVFAVFARAKFTGKLLEVARLIEHTFGKGSFRRIGIETGKKPIQNVSASASEPRVP